MQNTNLDKGELSGRSVSLEPAAEVSVATDHDAMPSERGLRAARIASIIAAIDNGFSDPQFSTSALAGSLGLSVRYVQDLMKLGGVSVTGRILELRLLKAHAMLMRDHSCVHKISNIALACGFNEVSHFHRCFRRRFATTPARFRITAQVGNSGQQEVGNRK